MMFAFQKTVTLTFFLLGFTVASCSRNEPLHELGRGDAEVSGGDRDGCLSCEDGGPEAEGDRQDGADSVASDAPDGGDPGKSCHDNTECPKGYRCKDGRCILGWTLTPVPRFSAMGVDSQGNVFLAGTFQGDVDFDPGPGVDIKSSAGGVPGFILKLNARGDYVETALLSGTREKDKLKELKALAVGSDDDIYVGGVVDQGTIDVEPGPGVTEVSSPDDIPQRGNIRPLFVSRLAPDFHARWVNTFWDSGDPFHELPSAGLVGIQITQAGNVVVAGYYHLLQWGCDASYIDCSEIYAVADAGFARQLAGTGEHLWTAGQQVRRYLNTESVYPTDLAVVVNGNMLVTGYFSGPSVMVDFDPGRGQDWRTGDEFIWRLGQDGSYLGAVVIDYLQDIEYSRIVAHNSGGLLVAGRFKGTQDLDPGPGVDMHQSADGGCDSFVVMLEPNFDLRWSYVPADPENGSVTALATDDQGTIFLALAAQDRNWLVALSAEGQELWRRDFPGAIDDIVARDGNGLYLAGSFSKEGDFDPGPGEDFHTPTKENDTFVTRLTLNATY